MSNHAKSLEYYGRGWLAALDAHRHLYGGISICSHTSLRAGASSSLFPLLSLLESRKANKKVLRALLYLYILHKRHPLGASIAVASAPARFAHKLVGRNPPNRTWYLRCGRP